MSSLVSNVASAYFQLLELDSEMGISRSTLVSRKESLRLVEVRAKGGATSMLDVRQSELLVYTAAGTIPDLERRIEQQENLISVLLGKNPAPVTRGSRWWRVRPCRRCRRDYPLLCWRGVRIFSLQNSSWLLPTRG